jgi:hypothetical protein
VATETALIRRVRLELGDNPLPFRGQFRGTGSQLTWDLPANNVSADGLRVYTIAANMTITDIDEADYDIDLVNGTVTLHTAPTRDLQLVVEGVSYSLFSDAEIGDFLHDALLQHTNNASETVRYRDEHGFIKYLRSPITLENLPEIEEVLVALLATIEALWALSTDASTDIDVHTSEGTFVPRSQRYGQIVGQIGILTQKYQSLCSQLNVGLYRIEVMNLRRVSKTTGRLVPLYVAREYDDASMPVRITPEIDTREADFDGPPSPADRGLF